MGLFWYFAAGIGAVAAVIAAPVSAPVALAVGAAAVGTAVGTAVQNEKEKQAKEQQAVQRQAEQNKTAGLEKECDEYFHQHKTSNKENQQLKSEVEGQYTKISHEDFQDTMNGLTDDLEPLTKDLTTQILEQDLGTPQDQPGLSGEAKSLRKRAKKFHTKLNELSSFNDEREEELSDQRASESCLEKHIDLGSDCSESFIPPELENALNQLCACNGVSQHVLIQDAENEKSIEIFGIDVEVKLDGKLDEIMNQWDGYHIFSHDQAHDPDSALVEQFTPVVGKYGIAARGSKCELIVKANNVNNDTVAYAVAPARMLFSPKKNQRLQQTIDFGVSETNVLDTPPTALYAVQYSTNEGEENGNLQDVTTVIAYVDGNARSFLGYRYQIQPGTNANSPTSFLNDIVLLPLSRNDAMKIDERLGEITPTRRPQVINVFPNRNGQNRREVLGKYIRPNRRRIHIRVKNHEGSVVANRYSLRHHQLLGIPFSLMFRLDAGTLAPGDFGHIVYEIITGESGTEYPRPLAMLIGRPRRDQGYDNKVYQAVFLQQAFEDIEHTYKEGVHALKNIRPYYRLSSS